MTASTLRIGAANAKLLILVFSAGLLGLCVYLQAEPPKKEADTVKVRVQARGRRHRQAVPGIVRVFRAGEDKPLALPGLYDRLRGLKTTATLAGWYVVPAAGGETTLPRGKVRIEAVSGLETALAVEEIDLTEQGAGRSRGEAQARVSTGSSRTRRRQHAPAPDEPDRGGRRRVPASRSRPPTA